MITYHLPFDRTLFMYFVLGDHSLSSRVLLPAKANAWIAGWERAFLNKKN